MSTKLIKTKRLTLRKFNKNDLLAFHNNWANNPNVTRFLTWPAHESLEDTKRVLDMFIASYDDGGYNWAIVPDIVGEPIGNISVVKDDGFSLEIGYCIGEAYWNRGYATEALEAVLSYLLNKGYRRIVCKHDINNQASGRVMKKCGMKLYTNEYERNNQGMALCACYEIVK